MNFVKANNQFEFISALQIRTIVFMKEQNVDPELELDDEDLTCDHFVVYDDDKIIGTCRILKHDNEWHVGRVAVLKEQRHKKCGSFMLQEVEKIARTNDVKKLTLGAQCAAIPFYNRNGYKEYGNIYLDANIEHKMMEKLL